MGLSRMLKLYQAENCGCSQTVCDTLIEIGLTYVAHNPGQLLATFRTKSRIQYSNR